MVDDIADGRGANEKAVVVIVEAGIVFVPGGDEFRGVTGKNEVLQVHVAEKDLLVAPVEGVESAVGIFFEELKIGDVVFDAITVEVSENTQGRFFVDKEKPTEVGVELLDAGARRDEVVVGTEVVELHFSKGFLEGDLIVEAVGAAAGIGAHETELADFQVVETELRSDANAPVDGLEGRVAVKQIKGETKRLIKEGLFSFAKETRAARASAADVAGRRNAAAIEKGFRRSGDVQKSLLAEALGPDGLVAFESITIEGIVPSGLGVDVLAFLRVAAVIGLLKGPAVCHGVVDIGRGRKDVCRNSFDVGGIGIEAMTKLAIGSQGRLHIGGKRRSEIWETREARARLPGCHGDHSDFKAHDFVWL